jgi:hypothetical protein
MKRKLLCLSLVFCSINVLWAQNSIPANHPYIQYYGRWDFSDPLAPTHSWPGVYIYAEFEGTSISVRTNDNFSYYNVFIDDSLYLIFHGTTSGVNSYTVASGLADTIHTILFTLRSETNWTKFTFNGFNLDDGKNLLPPPEKPARKIEFIGDSYTVASGNEWTDVGAAPSDFYTNNYLGFGPIIARNYNAQYHVSARGGIGLVLDYLGNYSNNFPSVFDRTLLYTPMPKWDYSNWTPHLVVICLGLNDYSGWGGYTGSIAPENADLYKATYHELISTIMSNYPGVKILAVAENGYNPRIGWGVSWLQTNVSQVVAEENLLGHTNVFYAGFPYYGDSCYVHNGHPNIETDQKIADTLIAIIDTIDAWTPYQNLMPPRITDMPLSPFIVCDTSYVLRIQTDSYDTVRYSTSDKSYSEMENVFTSTGTQSHSVTLSLQHGLEYTYYVRAKHLYGTVMDTSAVVHFTVDTTKQVAHWNSLFYDDSQWKNGPAPLSSLNDTSTVTKLDTVRTAYFRKKIFIDSTENIASLILWIKGYNGTILYVNGQELIRYNLVAGTEITYSTYATDSLTFTQRTTSVFKSLLQRGENMLAIEMHAAKRDPLSLSFDAKLTGGSTTINFPYGTAWTYYDGGKIPDDIVVNKPTKVVQEMESLLPAKLILYANYPNPFNPTTTIRYALPARSHVSMKIFDLLGREIVTLVDEEIPAGMYNVQFNASTLSSGMYFCRLHAARSVEVSKLILVK